MVLGSAMGEFRARSKPSERHPHFAKFCSLPKCTTVDLGKREVREAAKSIGRNVIDLGLITE